MTNMITGPPSQPGQPGHVSVRELARSGIEQLVPGDLRAPVLEGGQQLWEFPASRFQDLSARQREIVVLLAIGFSNQRIARLLGVTERTVKNHVAGILAKLRFESRLQAGLAALICLMELAANGHSQPFGGALSLSYPVRTPLEAT